MKKIIPAILLVLAAWSFSLQAAPFSGSGIAALKNVKADKWDVVGGNYVVTGNVSVKYEDYVLTCDKAVVNPKLRDIEAIGNCQLIKWKTLNKSLTLKEFAKLEKHSDVRVTVEGISGDIFGERKLQVKIEYISEAIRCSKIVGNVKSGYFRFDKMRLKTPFIMCRADAGERLPEGVLQLTNGEVSSCSYLDSDNAHYSLGASKIYVTPHKTGFYGAEHIDTDFDDHSITMWNGVVKAYGVPVFYLPFIWKPRDEDPGLFNFQWGKTGDWGYHFNFYKTFKFSNYPLSKIKVRADWYTMRGVGYGTDGVFATENSRTDFFAYGIYDLRPSRENDYDEYRIKVPHARFNLRASHLSHITPRLDFRGSVDYSSDPYILRDFFNQRFTADPEPATFFSLEQQFDYLSASLYVRPRLMKSYTTVEKLPEFLFLGPRQQIFNTPLYYQGDMSTGYYRMNWIDFDISLKKLGKRPGDPLKDYDAFRFDTTHFLYLPLRTPYFVFTPRAGFKMTAYSQSSEKKVKDEDLMRMFAASSPTSMSGRTFTNYDDKGGSKVRWVGELGAELSTKVHNTWSDLRSSVLQLDGLRHIMRPYANYTFVSSPSVNKDYLYYFDEIDRIEKQSFFRFGLENRLQTRSGNKMREWLRLENYIDIHTFKRDGMSAMGDFCTVLTFAPLKDLTITTFAMIDTGNNNEEMPDDIRHNRNVGRTGIDIKWLNRWNVAVKYSPIQDFSFMFAYDYVRPYNGRYPYSMGSTLSMIESTRWFRKDWNKHEETFSVGVELPITPDRRTFAAFTMGYDFIDGHVSYYRFRLRRILHCLELFATVAFEYDNEIDPDKKWEIEFSMGMRFTGMDSPVMEGTNSVLQSANMDSNKSNFLN